MGRILVVEDSELDFEFIRRALEIRGHELTWVDSVDEGLHRLRMPPMFDLVLTDDGVPDGGAERLLFEVRKDPALAHLPIVVVTGHSTPEVREHFLASGFNGYFSKPIDPVCFGPDVEEFLKTRRAPDRESSIADSVLTGVPPPPVDTAVAERLACIREKYRRQLPERLAQFAKDVKRLRAIPEDLNLLTEIRQQIHGLRGTSQSLGFEKMAKALMEIQQSFFRMNLVGRTIATEEWERISETLDAILDAPIATIDSRPPDETTLIGTYKILWVDDDPLFLTQAVALGQAQFVDVIPTSSAAEALESVTVSRPDAAVIDLWLPEPEKGLALARDLRSLPGCASLPIAFVSVDGSFSSRIAASRFGAALYLAKPLDQPSFTAIVQQLFLIEKDEKARVLVVDDDKVYTAMTADLLRAQGIHVTTLLRPEKILELIQDVAPDVILLDIEMPGMNGFDVCRVLRSAPRWRDTVIIFVSASSGAESRTEAFCAGADDYVVKPFVNDEMVARVNARIARQRAAGLRSDRDALTGILRRHAFLDRLSLRISEANRHGLPMSIALIDIDELKEINDIHGHLVGDRVLVSFAHLIESVCRAHDLLSRWGGDEFALSFFNEDASSAQKILGRIREKFNKIIFEGGENGVFQVGFSGGIATMPFDGETISSLLSVSDQRLYRAKREGRNRVT